MAKPQPFDLGQDWDRSEDCHGAWLFPTDYERHKVMDALMPFRMTEVTGAARGEHEPLVTGGPGRIRPEALASQEILPPPMLEEVAEFIGRGGDNRTDAEKDWDRKLQAVKEYQYGRSRELLAAERTIQRLEAAFGGYALEEEALALEAEVYQAQAKNKRLETSLTRLRAI